MKTQKKRGQKFQEKQSKSGYFLGICPW